MIRLFSPVLVQVQALQGSPVELNIPWWPDNPLTINAPWWTDNQLTTNAPWWPDSQLTMIHNCAGKKQQWSVEPVASLQEQKKGTSGGRGWLFPLYHTLGIGRQKGDLRREGVVVPIVPVPWVWVGRKGFSGGRGWLYIIVPVLWVWVGRVVPRVGADYTLLTWIITGKQRGPGWR